MRIARGDFRRALEARSPWKVGYRVSTYFRTIFCTEFVLLSESLIINSAAVSLTSTPVEFNFAMAGNITDPSMSAGKVSDLMAHQNGVRCNIVGEMEVKVTHKDGSQEKLHDICSTHEGRHEYLTRLDEFADEIVKPNSPVKTVKELRASAGKDFDTAAAYPHAVIEIGANKRRKLDFLSPAQLRAGIDKMNTAKANGDLYLPQSEDDLRLKKAKTVKKRRLYKFAN